jgi:aryl-alcohol dehydrogenase-like predicted oxidoreductase
MTARSLGQSGLAFEPLVFGCNVLGWTLQEPDAFAVLDAFVERGFTAFDTADVYGNGLSETTLGNWVRSRCNREDVLVFTKVGAEFSTTQHGLSASYIERSVEDSLGRLQIDYIDLFQSHVFDPLTPQEETLQAYDRLIRQGKVRAIGASNFSAEQHQEADAIAKANAIETYTSEQVEYNLLVRCRFEGPVQDFCVSQGVGVLTYFSLASGFLTGKYRSDSDLNQSPRGFMVQNYFGPDGIKLLATMDHISNETGATLAEIALAWLLAQPGVTAPIASATSLRQLQELCNGARLILDQVHLDALTNTLTH